MGSTFRICQREYGVDDSCSGGRQWARLGSIRPPRPIETAAQYVGVCRSLARRTPPPEYGGPPWLEGEDRLDGRLVAVGFRRIPPREWILGDRRDGRPARTLADFAEWWRATQPRPDVVGSDHNASPETAFRLWSAGPAVRRAVRHVPHVWGLLVTNRIHPRNMRRAADIGRAARRSSALECYARISARALAALGRCCPEMQRAALAGAGERARERVADHEHAVIRIRDLDWAEAARVQAEILREGDRARLRYAYRVFPRRRGAEVSWRFWGLVRRVFGADTPIGAYEALEWARSDGSLTPAEWLERRPRTLYKVLRGGQSFHGGSLVWSLPTQRADGSWEPGAWHETPEARLCSVGLHLTWDPPAWGGGLDDTEVYLVEAEDVGMRDLGAAKVVARRVRLLRRVA